MTRPQPQYLRSANRWAVRACLEKLPRAREVRIRGTEIEEIRSVDDLLRWIASYGYRVAKLLDELAVPPGWRVYALNSDGQLVAAHTCGERVTLGSVGRDVHLPELLQACRRHSCPREPEERELDHAERAAGPDR